VDICVARQPILDRFRRTHAYELLFRDGLTSAFGVGDPDRASARVLDISFFAFAAETLTGSRPAFVNFTREALIGRLGGTDPGNLLVAEILEHVPDPEVLRGCHALKAAGCTIALDDVVTATLPAELVALADIVKVDFSKTSAFTRHHIARTLRRPGLKMLAEKVETEKEFRQALDSGYEYFQGYFFTRPGIVAGRAIPASKLSILNLIREAHRPDALPKRVEDIIKHEVSLALKLLTHLRAAAQGLQRPVESVQDAMPLLGDQALQKWASVIAVAALASDHPNELLVTSVARASFCEGLLIEMRQADRGQDAFFLGLFSMIEAFLGRPLSEAVERLPLSEEARIALLGGDNLLYRAYTLALAWERGAWDEVTLLAADLGLPTDVIASRYKAALEFGNCVGKPEAEKPARV
jgi:EAL and modified HD-GYP domain-containing signal transduction protein